MNKMSFIKYCIVDGLKLFFPKVEFGIPEEKVEKLPKVPVDYVCKGLCSQCRYSNER
ncbi:MAG: hypothetical protein K2M23_01495 [Alphaproteobacteria bacterium]|nr:hypothetical protein [Alphaproteobacteria bacterium]